MQFLFQGAAGEQGTSVKDTITYEWKEMNGIPQVYLQAHTLLTVHPHTAQAILPVFPFPLLTSDLS